MLGTAGLAKIECSSKRAPVFSPELEMGCLLATEHLNNYLKSILPYRWKTCSIEGSIYCLWGSNSRPSSELHDAERRRSSGVESRIQ